MLKSGRIPCLSGRNFYTVAILSNGRYMLSRMTTCIPRSQLYRRSIWHLSHNGVHHKDPQVRRPPQLIYHNTFKKKNTILSLKKKNPPKPFLCEYQVPGLFDTSLPSPGCDTFPPHLQYRSSQHSVSCQFLHVISVSSFLTPDQPGDILHQRSFVPAESGL